MEYQFSYHHFNYISFLFPGQRILSVTTTNTTMRDTIKYKSMGLGQSDAKHHWFPDLFYTPPIRIRTSSRSSSKSIEVVSPNAHGRISKIKVYTSDVIDSITRNIPNPLSNHMNLKQVQGNQLQRNSRGYIKILRYSLYFVSHKVYYVKQIMIVPLVEA